MAGHTAEFPHLKGTAPQHNMPAYYLDIETTGLDPAADSVITIQYQELERYTGRPRGGLSILKSWESGERDMLERFVRDSGINSHDRFEFIPVGYNLGFEHKFLRHKAGIDILVLPYIDLQQTAILMNRGEFHGSGMARMTGKQHPGSPIPEWYQDGLYDRIMQYVEQEAEAFCEFYVWLLDRLPAVHREFIADHA